MALNHWWYIGIALAVFILIGYIEKDKKSSRSWGVLGLSFIIGLSIFGILFVQSKKSETSLRVVGYASKLFDSDLVKWNLSLQKNTSISGLQNAYTIMASDVQAFKEYLIANGVAESEIDIQPVFSTPVYENYGNIASYNLNQNIMILSSDLATIEKLSLNPEFFARRSILLSRSSLDFLYTKLPELKKQLLAEATEDAVARAEEISGSAKVKLGKMREARAGVFQITEPYSTEVSDYGIYNTGTKNKSISVTLTAVFNLK